MQVTKLDNVYFPEFIWQDNESGLNWLYFRVPTENIFETFQAMPSALILDSIPYKRMSFNSDSGMIAYKQVNHSDIARGI